MIGTVVKLRPINLLCAMLPISTLVSEIGFVQPRELCQWLWIWRVL